MLRRIDPVACLRQHYQRLSNGLVVKPIAHRPLLLLRGCRPEHSDRVLTVVTGDRHELMRIFILSLDSASRYLAPMASINSLRVLMLIRHLPVTSVLPPDRPVGSKLREATGRQR
jgi:hypothetical protein